MTWLDKIIGKIIGIVPLDYEKGYIDGFAAGLKFYKESIDMMHKAVLDSEKTHKEMLEHAKKLRKGE